MSRAAIESFYAAFQRLDGAAMKAAYAEHVAFEDAVFTLEGREQVGGMWCMLTDAIRNGPGAKTWRIDVSAVTERSAHWEPHYVFSATGRPVHNIIDAKFEFDGDGKIVKHVDHFDFWRWSRQALGAPGLLLGWSSMLKKKVRGTAAKNLENYLAKQGEAKR
ncbi:MAG: nuclear transport factor 2 family protein [Kofleriaceae bacterium]